MANASSNIELVQGAFAAATSGDWAILRSLVHDDVTWHIPGHIQIRWRRRWSRGLRRQAADAVQRRSERRTPERFGAGEHVATLQHNSAASEDRVLDIVVINLFTITDGRLARMQTFPSDQYALDMFWGPSDS